LVVFTVWFGEIEKFALSKIDQTKRPINAPMHELGILLNEMLAGQGFTIHSTF
jgi:hypothetical protein